MLTIKENKTIYLNALRIVVAALILLFPLCGNLVEHASSIILLLLSILGIVVWFKPVDQVKFSSLEKYVMISFAGYFFICFFFFFFHRIITGPSSLKWDLDDEIRMLAFIPIYYLFCQTKIKAWPLWFGVLTGSISSGIYAINFFIEHGGRVAGPYGPIYFGMLSLVFAFLSLCSIPFFHSRRPIFIFLPVIASLFGLLAAFLSGTTGAIIAVPILTGLLFFQIRKCSYSKLYQILFLATIGLFVIGISFSPAVNIAKQRFSKKIEDTILYFDGKATNEMKAIRLKLWSESVKMIARHPFIGNGHDGFSRKIHQDASTVNFPAGVKKYSSSCHNMYLTVLVDYGIPGGIVLMTIFVLPIFCLRHEMKLNPANRDISFAGFTLIAAFMQFAVSGTIFHRSVCISVYLILLALIMAIQKYSIVSENK